MSSPTSPPSSHESLSFKRTTSMGAAEELQAQLAEQRRQRDQVHNERPEFTSAFQQQNMCSWQPVIGAGPASTSLLITAAIFIIIGSGLLHYSQDIEEVLVPYTDCESMTNRSARCSELMGNFGPDPTKMCKCNVSFTVPRDYQGRVYMYYELTHFYQSHRRYVRSRDNAQLGGDGGPPSIECRPFQFSEASKKAYWPCGANARAMFQDRIDLFDSAGEVEVNRIGIAWDSDKNIKFRNPDDWNTTKFRDEHVKPDTWIRSPWELDTECPNNNGLINEDLIVWMRTAAFADFRKLYRILEPDTDGKGLKAGNYYLIIEYTFPVKSFGGTKAIVFSTTSKLGGRNLFFGLAFVIVAIVYLLLGLFFLALRLLDRRLEQLRVQEDGDRAAIQI